MLIHSITLTNFLSFGPQAERVSMRPLNVIIGTNGAGKSNFIEAVDLLRSAPDQFLRPIREGGGIQDWLWKGAKQTPEASINAVFGYQPNLRYVLSFTSAGQRFEITGEQIENETASEGNERPYFYYHFNGGQPVLNIKNERYTLQRESVDFEKSILSQRRDPEHYPEITWLANTLGTIRLYREWSFGRDTPPRMVQKTDMPNDFLECRCGNLGLVLNSLRHDLDVKKRILEALRILSGSHEDFDVRIEGGTVQVFLQEGRFMIPATRLSDGTLRYLCLLAILCHPRPPPLVCIEEPELGLHPDILPAMADLLKEASERCQLIVTTHSDILVDAMTDDPESVLVCEKDEGGTVLRRLDAEQLRPWLEKYRLGQLWTSGEIGGTRW